MTRVAASLKETLPEIKMPLEYSLLCIDHRLVFASTHVDLLALQYGPT